MQTHKIDFNLSNLHRERQNFPFLWFHRLTFSLFLSALAVYTFYCATSHARLINHKGVSDFIYDNCCTSTVFVLTSWAFVVDPCGFWQQEAEATLRKARALKAQRREDYQKAHSSTNRSQEEQSNAGNKQLEKKRRLEEEALQKVGRGEDDRRNIIGMINGIL